MNPLAAMASVTILVVEKDVWVRSLVTEELREEGYACIETSNAGEALDVLRSHVRVDLVITSLRLPGAVDGGALSRLVRTEFSFIKILMCSGESPEPQVRAVIDAYLRKPFSIAQLTRQVQLLVPTGLDRVSP